ncbi:ribosome biogenesis protein BRX1 [Enteropsectra breve]|nr:ribosome biogenesis protein BRX1 [Enteropsectra breve]
MTVLLLTTKGADENVRHFSRDLEKLIKVEKESNFDIKKNLSVIEKYMDINECSNALFIETTKRGAKMWLASTSMSLRFNINSIQSIYEMKSEVNYHKNSGHTVLYTDDFETCPKMKLAKEMLSQIFVPSVECSIERALCFYNKGGKIIMRNYKIEGMAEIGPRFEIELDKIFTGCFNGSAEYVIDQ